MEAVKLNKANEIFPNRVPLAETVRNVWAATCEANTTREDILNPKYWVHVTRNFHPGDIIEVRTDDSAFYAELYVVSCSKSHIKIHEKQFLDFTKLPTQDTEEDLYTVAWKGPHLKHCVMKGQEKVIEGLQTKEEAEQAKVNLMKTL